MRKTFQQLVSDFLKNYYSECVMWEDGSLSLNMHDVNCDIRKVPWEDSLNHYLSFHKKKASFKYGNGNWAEVHEIK